MLSPNTGMQLHIFHLLSSHASARGLPRRGSRLLPTASFLAIKSVSQHHYRGKFHVGSAQRQLELQLGVITALFSVRVFLGARNRSRAVAATSTSQPNPASKKPRWLITQHFLRILDSPGCQPEIPSEIPGGEPWAQAGPWQARAGAQV